MRLVKGFCGSACLVWLSLYIQKLDHAICKWSSRTGMNISCVCVPCNNLTNDFLINRMVIRRTHRIFMMEHVAKKDMQRARM